MLTEESAQREYHRLNVTYFDSSLPDVEIEIVKDLRLDGAKRSRLWGATTKGPDGFKIQLQHGQPTELWTLKLAHEMAHVKHWPKSHRSRAWKAEVARLASAGLLAEVF
jgi:hypothetical protein